MKGKVVSSSLGFVAGQRCLELQLRVPISAEHYRTQSNRVVSLHDVDDAFIESCVGADVDLDFEFTPEMRGQLEQKRAAWAAKHVAPSELPLKPLSDESPESPSDVAGEQHPEPAKSQEPAPEK